MHTREPVTKTVEVKALTDLRPDFVSLVGHGANQTPLKVVKSDAEPVESVEISRIDFDANTFASEEVVAKWLTDGGYKDYAVSKTDSGFSVSWDIPVGYDATSLTAINDVEGVSVLLVPAIKQDEETKDTIPASIEEIAVKSEAVTKSDKEAAFSVAKADLVKKYDYWEAYFNENAITIADAFRAGADSLPVGIYELNDAFYIALKNATEMGDIAAVTSIAQEFAAYYIKLVEAIPEAIKQEKESTMKEEEVQKADTPVTTVISNPESLTQSNVDVNAIVTAITTGFSSILSSFGGQVAKQEEVKKSDEVVEDESVAVIKALQDRIDALESRGQASNNLGITEALVETKKKEDNAFLKRATADILGIC
jgi:hypothetical protein